MDILRQKIIFMTSFWITFRLYVWNVSPKVIIIVRGYVKSWCEFLFYRKTQTSLLCHTDESSVTASTCKLFTTYASESRGIGISVPGLSEVKEGGDWITLHSYKRNFFLLKIGLLKAQ